MCISSSVQGPKQMHLDFSLYIFFLFTTCTYFIVLEENDDSREIHCYQSKPLNLDERALGTVVNGCGIVGIKSILFYFCILAEMSIVFH